jgi:cation transport ATPase
MKCPKCKHVQRGTVECESCGIVFADFYALLIKKKFDQAVQKYHDQEFDAALEIFNAIIGARIPKDEGIVSECKEFISLIKGDSQDEEILVLADESTSEFQEISQEPYAKTDFERSDNDLALKNHSEHKKKDIISNNQRNDEKNTNSQYQSKPYQTRIALLLLWVSLLPSLLISLGCLYLKLKNVPININMTIMIVSSIIMAILFYNIGQGRHWALTTFIFFFCLSAFAATKMKMSHQSIIAVGLSTSLFILQLSAICLLFQKPSILWFRQAAKKKG